MVELRKKNQEYTNMNKYDRLGNTEIGPVMRNWLWVVFTIPQTRR